MNPTTKPIGSLVLKSDRFCFRIHSPGSLLCSRSEETSSLTRIILAAKIQTPNDKFKYIFLSVYLITKRYTKIDSLRLVVTDSVFSHQVRQRSFTSVHVRPGFAYSLVPMQHGYEFYICIMQRYLCLHSSLLCSYWYLQKNIESTINAPSADTIHI